MCLLRDEVGLPRWDSALRWQGSSGRRGVSGGGRRWRDRPLVADADGKAALMDWWRDAVCAHEDPELFFPVAVTGAALRDQQARAKAICRRCPVIHPCLSWALQATGAQGVWGGTCEEERRGLLRGRAQGESALGVTGSA